MIHNDHFWMRRALVLARAAAKRGEVPIGAVIVSADGEYLGGGSNAVERFASQLEHAELRAIRGATRKLDDWRLDGASIYVTLEPCMMCMSALALSRVERVVFAARSPLFGYRLDKEGALKLYTGRIKTIEEGLLAEPAGNLLKAFFAQKRETRRK